MARFLCPPGRIGSQSAMRREGVPRVPRSASGVQPSFSLHWFPLAGGDFYGGAGQKPPDHKTAKLVPKPLARGSVDLPERPSGSPRPRGFKRGYLADQLRYLSFESRIPFVEILGGTRRLTRLRRRGKLPFYAQQSFHAVVGRPSVSLAKCDEEFKSVSAE